MLDSDHFTRGIRRHRSERWQENYRTFEDPARAAAAEDAAPTVRQWEKKRAVLRTHGGKRAALPVVP
jgi:hypothetical protein